MSETSTLISYTSKITRAELAQIPIPPSTSTHVPIPHAAVVEALVDTLSHRQISIVDEEFAVSKDGMELFGVLDLVAGFEGCRFAIGVRCRTNRNAEVVDRASLSYILSKFDYHVYWTALEPEIQYGHAP